MANVWTHGVWRVKSGHEDEFVRWWTSTVDAGDAFGARGATLLRDRNEPSVFRSFGAWPDMETIERFRAELGPRLAEISELLEGVEMLTLDEEYPGG